MLARCSRPALRSTKNAPPFPTLSLRLPSRSSSSVPERTRRFANGGTSFFSRPAYRRFVLLLGLGGGLVVGWQIYSYTQRDTSFVKYALVAKHPVSSTASVFCLEPKQQSETFEIYKDAWRRGIWNVDFKQPQLQILRAYTPLPPAFGMDGAEEKGQLRFLIRKDPHGEVSSYLHNLPVGAEIEMRGPNLEYAVTPEVRQVVFLAGGTGIAPALQIAHALFERPNGMAEEHQAAKGRKLHILWANRTREDCLGGVSDEPPSESMPPKPTWSGLFSKPKTKPPVAASQDKGLIVQDLDALKQRYPGRVTVEYYVNTEDTWIDDDAVMRALSRFDDKDFSAGSPTPQEQRQILISGPPGFIAHLAGPKQWRNGREEQGPVSRIVAHAISRNPHDVKVWKI